MDARLNIIKSAPTHTDSIEWFASWLARLPFSFSVEGPVELKEALRRYAERLLKACDFGL